MANPILSTNHCDVFISYRHEDTLWAQSIYNLLRDQNYDVFWDKNLNERQLTDNEFGSVLEDMIVGCKDFILILSKNVFDPNRADPNKRDWVMHELSVVKDHYKNIRVSVFSVDDTTFPPKGNDIPDVVEELTSIAQCYPLYISWNRIDDKDYLAKELQDQLIAKPQKSTIQQFADEAAYIMDAKELERLEKQAENTKFCDMAVLNEILDENPPDKRFRVLDIGCARGIVGRSRFVDDRFQHILGLDCNEKCINLAIEYVKDKPEYDKFSYACCDLQDEPTLRRLLANERKKFDIIFATQVLHHLRTPHESGADTAAIACLSLLCEYLADDGYIVIRTTDDDMKIGGTNADTKLIREIVQLTYANPKVTADRKTGRKLYSWLHGCGISDIRIRTFSRSTEGLHGMKKLALFNESFDWRGSNTYDEEDKKLQNYKDMTKKLNELRSRFLNTEFWYCGFEFIAIGRQHNN